MHRYNLELVLKFARFEEEILQSFYEVVRCCDFPTNEGGLDGTKDEVALGVERKILQQYSFESILWSLRLKKSKFYMFESNAEVCRVGWLLDGS